MSNPMHNHKSDADFLLDVAKRLRSVPVSYGLDGFDIDCIADLSSRLRKAANAKKPKIAIGNYTICELRVGRSCETDFAILVPADDLETTEDQTERKLAAVTAPDNGTAAEVLAAILECARAWVPEARIMGNVRAGDIARAVCAVLEVQAPSIHVLPPVVTGQMEIESDVTAADLGVNAEPSEDEIGPHEQALRDAVEPFLDWLEMRESGAHIKEVREGLIGVDDVLPDGHVVLGAHLRAHKDHGVLNMGHFRRLQAAYDGKATLADQARENA